MNLFKKFQKQYTIKKYDTTKKVNQNLVDQIIEAARIAPTTSGQPPLKVIEISNQKTKKEIMMLANNQQHIIDCSHLLVFVSSDNPSENKSEENLAHATFQTYLSFGFAIAKAKELNIDSTPIEIFDNKALDSHLNLNQYGLKSVTLLCLGYRDDTKDWLSENSTSHQIKISYQN